MHTAMETCFSTHHQALEEECWRTLLGIDVYPGGRSYHIETW